MALAISLPAPSRAVGAAGKGNFSLSPIALSYAAAPVLVGVTTWLLHLIQNAVNVMEHTTGSRPFGIGFIVPIVVSTLMGGRRAGYFALFLSIACLILILMPDRLSQRLIHDPNLIETLFLGIVGALVVMGVEAIQQNVGLLEQVNRTNEQRERFVSEVLMRVTDGKLIFCNDTAMLPGCVGAKILHETIVGSTLAEVRHGVQAAAMQAQLPLERTQDLVTATGECAMNAVVHAGGGDADIYVADSEGVVQVWVRDRGAGIDIENLPQATLEKGYSTAGSMGYGFKIMLMSADRIYLLTGPEGTTVVLEQYRTPPSLGLMA